MLVHEYYSVSHVLETTFLRNNVSGKVFKTRGEDKKYTFFISLLKQLLYFFTLHSELTDCPSCKQMFVYLVKCTNRKSAFLAAAMKLLKDTGQLQWNPDITMYQGTGEITSLYRGIVKPGFRSMHFTVTGIGRAEKR